MKLLEKLNFWRDFCDFLNSNLPNNLTEPANGCLEPEEPEELRTKSINYVNFDFNFNCLTDCSIKDPNLG